MIEYVIPNNPDDRILQKAKDLLQGGGLVILPTDTNWVTVVDPFSKKGVENLYQFKGEERSHHFSLLCDTIKRASESAYIDDNAYKILRNKIPGPYTFIFESRKPMIKALKASKADHQIGVRFSPSVLVTRLIGFYDGPLVSTNIPFEKYSLDESDELYGYQIEESLGHKALILDPGEVEILGQSTIIDFSTGVMELVREGSGDPALFHL
jgi:tRNA threonylcarbamoyl adenosine modification protein (Sua5/YciO/YrdC/YwlC family)